MMLRLMFDVILDRAHIGRTDTERSVTFLPRKIEPMFANPARGIGFQNLHRLCQRHRDRESDQQVRMICGASGAKHWNIVTLADSDEIQAESFEQSVGNQVAAVFRAENAMDQEVGKCVSHGASLWDLIVLRTFSRHYRAGLSHPVPSALKPWGKAGVVLLRSIPNKEDENL
jgi:hypothetical protein